MRDGAFHSSPLKAQKAKPQQAEPRDYEVKHSSESVTPPQEGILETKGLHSCENTHSNYVLIPKTHFEHLEGIIAWERAFLYAFKGAPTVDDVLPMLQNIVKGTLREEFETKARTPYIALALTKSNKPYMLLAVEEDKNTNMVWQAYIHRFHYTIEAPRGTAQDMHRAVWFMLDPKAAFLQTPGGGDYLYSPSYMQTKLEEMVEWEEDVNFSLLESVAGAVLFQSPEYQATRPPAGFNLAGFKSKDVESITVINFKFMQPKFHFTWNKESLKVDGKSFDDQIEVYKQRSNITRFVELRYRTDLSTKLGEIGVHKVKVNNDGKQLITLKDSGGKSLTLIIRGKRVVSYLVNDEEGELLKNTKRNPYAIVTAFLGGRSIQDAILELTKPLDVYIE